MRPRALPAVAAALAVGLFAVTACGGDDDNAGPTTGSGVTETTGAGSTTASTAPATGSAAPTTGSGATTVPEDSAVDGTLVPASIPEVSIPSETPTELVTTEITPGTGPKAGTGDMVVVNYVGVRSEDGTQFDTNFNGGPPFPVTLGAGGVIKGWDQGLQGAQLGERLQLDIPTDLAYGDQPPGEPIKAGDALSFVVDVLGIVPKARLADPPDETDVPVSDEPATKLLVEDLEPGDGAEIAEGDIALVHLVAARGDTGEVLQSTWTTGQPQPIMLADGQILPALVEKLPGMKVGGRRAITIPNAAFAKNGLTDAGLPADSDLVIIVDLLYVT
jgi:FKBP-type peptidyl-prolyl cis-trans isomerase